MINLIPYNLKTIIRNKLIIIYLIFLVSCETILLKFSLNDITAINAANFSDSVNILSIMYFVFFIIFSYENFRNIEETDLVETISTKYNGLSKVWISRLIIIILMSIISTIPFFIHYTLGFIKFDLSFLYYTHTLKSILLNFILVSIIGCMIGSLLSIKNNRKRGYFKIAIAVFLVSPWFINFIDLIYILINDCNTIDFYPIINRIQILPPNIRLGDHLQYGLPMENIRWESVIMLIILLAVAMLGKLSQIRKKIYNYMLIGIIVLWLGFAFVITPNDSLVRKDMRYFGGQQSDWYYDAQYPIKEQAPNFTIEEYNMEFKVRRQLYGGVEIVIGEKAEDNNYNFTLYRGYKIKSITDNNDNKLEFKRDGHYISIFANQDTDIIKINYNGNGNKFFSNNQGIALTGNFPYYPVAGYTTIPIQTTSSNVKFNVSVDTKQEVFSNIDGGDNRFEGNSDTLTLVSGFLREYITGGVTVIGSSIYDEEIDLLDLQTQLNDVNEKLGTDFNLEKKNLKVFYPPDYISVDDGYIKDAMVYDNQLITDFPSTLAICHGLVEGSLSDSQDTIILKWVFIQTLFFQDSVRESMPPKYPTEIEIEMYKNSSNENYLQKESVVTKLLLHQIDTLGEDIVFKQVYDYLKNYDGSVEQLDFLLGME